MSAAARQAEAEEATAVYQIALSRIGVEAVVDALQLWQSYPSTAKAQQSGRWLANAIAQIMGRRQRSVDLGRSYYRLIRALQTGYTVRDPHRNEGPTTTLGQLRREFAAEAAPEQGADSAAGKGADQASKDVTRAAGGHENDVSVTFHDDDSDRVILEELARLEELERQAQDAAVEELNTVLQALGPDNLQRAVDQIDTALPASTVDALREQAHNAAGARQAAAAARVVMNGARSTTWMHQDNDKRAIGWVRVSTTGTPCGWCAMLISRGPVYRSERSATLNYDDGDRYHDNCHCIAVPVFDRAWFDKAPLFDMNREYGDLWPKVTKGLGGKDALSAWRRFIRQQQADAKRAAA